MTIVTKANFLFKQRTVLAAVAGHSLQRVPLRKRSN